MPQVDFPDWRDLLAGKHLLFDTDAIVSLIAFKAASVLDTLRSLDCSFHYINPVLLELMSTNSSSERLSRLALLARHNFTELPLTATELKNARRIQDSMPIGIKGSPSAADFYIGGAMLHYSHGNTFLLTSNIKDFPMPLFPRESFIPLINQTDFKAISVLSIDDTKLVQPEDLA